MVGNACLGCFEYVWSILEVGSAMAVSGSTRLIGGQVRGRSDDGDAEFEDVEDTMPGSLIVNGEMSVNLVADKRMSPVRPGTDRNLWSSLREELVEKIIARLPLKALLRSRALSKKWRDIFLSSPFQSEVSSVSFRWGSYYPLYVSEKALMGYDRTVNKWQELVPLPEFPEDFCRGFAGSVAWTLSLCSVTGSLIILSYFSNHTLHIFVSNPINKSSKRLPPLDLTNDAPLDPRFDEWDDSIMVLPVSSFSYKILVFTRNVAANVLQARVYHSHLNAWTGPQRGPALPVDFRGLYSADHTGNICYLEFQKLIDETPWTLRSCLEDLMLFYAYDIGSGVFTQIILPAPKRGADVPIRHCKLAACGPDLFLVVVQGSADEDEAQKLEWVHAQDLNGIEVDGVQLDSGTISEFLYIPKESFIIFRLEQKTWKLTEITRGPPVKLSSRQFTGLVVCDKNSIYLQTETGYGEQEFGVVMYDMRKQVWSTLPLDGDSSGNGTYNNLIEFPFQPGLNPFVSA